MDVSKLRLMESSVHHRELESDKPSIDCFCPTESESRPPYIYEMVVEYGKAVSNLVKAGLITSVNALGSNLNEFVDNEPRAFPISCNTIPTTSPISEKLTTLSAFNHSSLVTISQGLTDTARPTVRPAIAPTQSRVSISPAVWSKIQSISSTPKTKLMSTNWKELPLNGILINSTASLQVVQTNQPLVPPTS